MKLIKSERSAIRISDSQIAIFSVSILCLLVFWVGCGDQVHLPSSSELADFNRAGPIRPSLDVKSLVEAEIDTGPYHVVPGDVLELTMPSIIRFVTAEEAAGVETEKPYLCRVNESGKIILPTVGDVEIEGKTLSEIEALVINSYYPQYVVSRPSVFARVIEYRTARVSISGAVRKPGIYSLRSDQMSLVALLMEAGGIIDEGAAVIQIAHRNPVVPHPTPRAVLETQSNTVRYAADVTNTLDMLTPQLDAKQYADNYNIERERDQRSIIKTVHNRKEKGRRNKKPSTNDPGRDMQVDEDFDKKAVEILNRHSNLRSERIAESYPSEEQQAVVLPIKGWNIPFTDVVLQDGDRVIVERLQPPLFSVVGLVNKPGNFPYPPDAEYNLMQALAFAGGLDRSTEPRYATLYRLNPDRTIVSAVFEVVNTGNGSRLTEALNTRIKAGDIIAVEHTPRTRTKLFLDTVFRINIGTYWRMNDAWDN